MLRGCILAVVVVLACSQTQSDKSVASGRVSSPVQTTLSAQAMAQEAPARTDIARGTVYQLWEAHRAAARERGRLILERASTYPTLQALVMACLEARGGEFFFTTPSTVSQALDVLLVTVKDAPSHGLNGDDYPVKALEDAVSRFRAASGQATLAALESDPIYQAVKGLVERADPPTDAEVKGLVAAGRIPDPVPDHVLARQAEALMAERQLYGARADVEALAMVTFFQYVLDMRFKVVAHPFKATRDIAGVIEKNRDVLLRTFDSFAKNPAETLASLPPKHPYYQALVKALRNYRELAARGPLPELKIEGKLKRGARGPLVSALRARLAAEGYLASPEGSVFDAELEEAVKAYQATHGFNVDGVVEKRHVKSMNVPLDQRVRQIELSLQRWRESEVRPDEPLYVRVNIPEFMMEIWEDGKLIQKHRVITGNNNWDKDVDARIEGRINRTKLFSAQIQRVILNPKWHVPARIRREELEFEILKEPDYYARHEFKVKTLPDGREEIYQESGRENALGRVKFVFPNPYGIFMHDTNLKSLFANEIRAFSHGCIRLQDPLEVAFLLLEKANNMPRERAQAILAHKEEREIELARKIPIFVEYNSVGIDELGRPQFFSDVYGYDRDYFDGKIPYSQEELELLMKKIPKVD